MKEYLLTIEYLFIYLFIGVFLLTLFILPRIRENSLKFGLYDSPDFRSSHSKIVPSFGGISFFVSLIFTLFFFQKYDNQKITVSIIVALTIMFFIGLKDDFRSLTPRKKFLGQIIAVFLLMIQPEFRIDTFHGFLGIQEINPILSVSLSVFLLIGLINAYNLIDGIDGMASIVGIIIASCFGFLFFKLNLFIYMCCISKYVICFFTI
nr:MraY family glycosyltransferase [Lutibacter sp. Hel_I_33_5]